MNYEEIKATRLSILPVTRFKEWVMDEITGLANDFGQRMDDDMLRHTATRLYEVLSTKYKSWYVGDVHAAFQTGLSGGYGAFHKVTVRSLFYFLKMAQNQIRNESVFSHEAESATKPFDRVKQQQVYNSPVAQLFSWATKNKIYLDFVDPTWTAERAMQEKAVSPKIKELANEFIEAKQMDLLPALRMRLYTQQENFNN